MSVYIKGGIVALLMLVGVVVWYQANMSKLPVNQSPDGFKVLDQMETEGVPDFVLPRVVAMQGQEKSFEELPQDMLRLSDFRGKILIVNFWASWCNPCLEEFPSMMKLVEAMKGDVVIVAVATDDDQRDVQTFLKAFGLPKPHFEVVWDKDKSAMKEYGITKVPESFLVGKDFKLVRKVLGIENWSTPGALEFFRELVDGKDAGSQKNTSNHPSGG